MMEGDLRGLVEKLETTRSLSENEYKMLLDGYSPEIAELITGKAVRIRQKIYGKSVYVRGLIEISNICGNDCLYCGIRRSNTRCERYRLTKEEILSCCEEGYRLGMRTFVLQGGENGYYSDGILTEIVADIRQKYPDCAITLSMGERDPQSYRRLYLAGANRYLLRHETADEEHYGKLHPPEMSFWNRMNCLQILKETGFQTGCGLMVGSPYQTTETLAKDLKFIEEFQPQMCGIGPFIPHHATPFAEEPAGNVELTCYLLSIVRLIVPNVLLPATTALGTADADGRQKGILAGANVVMPNLSPLSVRKKYELYDNKISTGEESAQSVELLRRKIAECGYEMAVDRGDVRLEVSERESGVYEKV